MSVSQFIYPNVLGKKSKMVVPLVSTDYLTMFYYRKNLLFLAYRMRHCLKRNRMEKEAERIKAWLEVHKYINYQK